MVVFQELELKNPSKKPEKEDTLVEKIVAQIVKNVQVKISNIHFRYEDSFTNAARPFSVGLTLSKLNFETTDENWQPQMVDRNEHIFRKLVLLDSFSMYWNPKVRLISHLSSREILSELVDTIARENYKPPEINYREYDTQRSLSANVTSDGNGFLFPSERMSHYPKR